MDLKKLAVIAVIILYALVALNYPLSDDEATFSVIGKSLDYGKLYSDIPDNKPPGIFFLTYLWQLFDFDISSLERLKVLFTTLFTAFITMKLSELLFPSSKKFSLFILVFFILASVFYLGGMVLLTETFEVFFLVSGTYLFFYSRKNNYQLNFFLLSALLFFIAFQFKQTALFFLAIPLLVMFFEKEFKKLAIFLISYIVLFIFLLFILNMNGILDSYIDLVWLSNFTQRGGDRLAQLFTLDGLLTKIFLCAFILPVLVPALFGISFTDDSVKSRQVGKPNLTIKNKLKQSIPILVPVVFVFILTMIIAQEFAFRFYLLEITPFLLVFLPVTLTKKSPLTKLSVWIPLLLLVLFFCFVLYNLFIGGYNIGTNIEDVNFINSQLECDNILSNSVKYWHLSDYSPNAVYSLAWWNNLNFNPDEFKESLKDSCFVQYSTKSAYSLSNPVKKPTDQLSIAEEVCICEDFERTNSIISICYSCNK